MLDGVGARLRADVVRRRLQISGEPAWKLEVELDGKRGARGTRAERGGTALSGASRWSVRYTPGRRCCAPSCRFRSRRLRSASPAWRIRSLEALSWSSFATRSRCSRSRSIAIRTRGKNVSVNSGTSWSLASWTIYTGVLAYLLAGGLFLAELLYRRRRFTAIS